MKFTRDHSFIKFNNNHIFMRYTKKEFQDGLIFLQKTIKLR